MRRPLGRQQKKICGCPVATFRMSHWNSQELDSDTFNLYTLRLFFLNRPFFVGVRFPSLNTSPGLEWYPRLEVRVLVSAQDFDPGEATAATNDSEADALSFLAELAVQVPCRGCHGAYRRWDLMMNLMGRR